MHSFKNKQDKKGDHPREMDQIKHDYSSPKKGYKKLGSAGIEGSLYQIDLLTLVLLNGMRKVKNWRLSTEDKAAAQLDDLIFEHLPSESAILLQAKHKKDEKLEITYQDLMSVNKHSEFSLPKYFFSYQEVKSNFNVQNVIICSNLKLDEKTKNILKEESVSQDSVMHFEGAENICYGFSGCSLPRLEQIINRYQAKNLKNKEGTISDEDINDFLNHLKFFPNCLSDKSVEYIIQQTISQVKFSENLNSKMIHIYIKKKMMDWFKEEKGRYLTEVEAKAFFCDLRSNKYCENLKLYDIRFKRNNLPVILQTRQKNDEKGKKKRQQNENDAPAKEPKRISHIIPDKEYMLNVVKIYQALPPLHIKEVLFVNPEETVEVQKEIIEAFEVQHYTILVMVCPNPIKENAVKEMCAKVLKVLTTHKYKHVILIAEEKNHLVTQLKLANINDYEVITDSISFADLEGTTQEKLKRKKLVNFQGSAMSLEDLFTHSPEDNLNEIVNSELLIKLARGDKSGVGTGLPLPDNSYISRSFNRGGQNLPEEDLWRSTEVSGEKVILIFDSAGMGKSCVLTSLAISIKRDNPHLWVIRLDLNNYTNIMGTILKKGGKSVGIIEMLNSQETTKLKSEFGRKLFTTSKRVVLMLDGADEISPTYTELVMNLIRDSLVQVNLVKIFVTTRPHMYKYFKEISELQSFTPESSSKNHQEKVPDLKFFTLEPFSKGNQIYFLREYWTETLDLKDDVRKNKCEIFAEALIEHISAQINDKRRNNFAGIPLQTRMLAEIFQEKSQTSGEEHEWEGCKDFSLSDNELPKLPTRIDLTQLYKLFIDKKRDVFINNRNPNGITSIDELLEEQFEKCQKFHRALALKVIFDSYEWNLFTCYTNVEWPIPSTFEDNFLFRVGIVQRQGENIEFLHRTFAEYYVAECLPIELEQKPVNKVFQQFFVVIMLRYEYYVIRAFLDSRMRNVWYLNEKNLCSCFHRDRISEEWLARFFEVCAEEGCETNFKYLIKCIDKAQRKILSKAVNKPHLMYDALSSASRYGHLNIVKLLMELNETFNNGKDAHKLFLAFVVMYAVTSNLETFKFLSREVDDSDKNSLKRSALERHETALIGRFGKVELWMERAGADIKIKDNIPGSTAHRGAVSMSRLQVVKFTVEEIGADINAKDNKGETALHKAAYGGELEIVKFLVEEAGADINIRNNYGATALHTAAYFGRLEIIKYLVEEAEADINVKNRDGETALHAVVYRGELEVVKCLVEGTGVDINIKNKEGRTAIHTAVYRGELEIIKCLVQGAGVDINVKNTNGDTAVHTAVCRGELEIVKCLIEGTGADINVKNRDDETAIYTAAYKGELEIVKYLVEEAKADINVKNNCSMTPLHGAADKGNLEVVKYLVEAGADVNVENSYGNTALRTVVYGCKLEIAKCLVKAAGTDINVKNRDGALFRAALGGELEIVKCLVEGAGADINVRNSGGWTVLHIAASKGELEIVKYLVEEAAADINVTCNYGMTALHAAAYGGKLEIVKYLVENARADINIENNYGLTVLSIVAFAGELEIVKCLMVEGAGTDINVNNNYSMTALHAAAFGGKLETIKYLVEETGVNINVKNRDGETALHRAAYGGSLEVVKYLVEEAGADKTVKNNQGETALHKAAYGGELEIVKYLVEGAGADKNVKNNQGERALHKAADQGHWMVVRFLSNSSHWVMLKMKTIQFFRGNFS